MVLPFVNDQTQRDLSTMKRQELGARRSTSKRCPRTSTSKKFSGTSQEASDPLGTQNENMNIVSDADRSTLPACDVLSFHQEEELVNLLTLMHNNVFTLSEDDIRSLVYEYAKLKGRIRCDVITDVHDGVYICKKVTLRGNKILEECKLIDKTCRPKFGTGQWVTDFLSRHARKLSPIYCRSGFDSQSLAKQFFDLFEQACSQAEITPDRLYNVVELKVTSGTSGTQSEEGPAHRKDPQFLAVAEICGSASGAHMPPTLIFPRLSPRRSGWLKPKSFYQWFEKFIDFAKPTKQKPVLLLFRGDAPYMKSVRLITKALENHVRLFCCPIHSSRDMQPLEVSFTPYLRECWFKVLKEWQMRNSNLKLTKDEVLTLFLTAFKKAKKTELDKDGFLASGIYPLERVSFEETNQNQFADEIAASESSNMNEIQMESESSSVIQMRTRGIDGHSTLGNRKRNSRIKDCDQVQPKLQKTKNLTEDPIIIDTSEESSSEEDVRGDEPGTDDCEYISTIQLMDDVVEENPWEVSEDPEKYIED
uniref:DDE-1 domain-containing protein n=1 Tax=Lygus hesperus TaxID=30085 RepID=A0A146LW52_LYGHE